MSPEPEPTQWWVIQGWNVIFGGVNNPFKAAVACVDPLPERPKSAGLAQRRASEVQTCCDGYLSTSSQTINCSGTFLKRLMNSLRCCHYEAENTKCCCCILDILLDINMLNLLRFTSLFFISDSHNWLSKRWSVPGWRCFHEPRNLICKVSVPLWHHKRLNSRIVWFSKHFLKSAVSKRNIVTVSLTFLFDILHIVFFLSFIFISIFHFIFQICPFILYIYILIF